MKVFISDKPLDVEEPRVSPICSDKEISRTGTGLQRSRQKNAVCALQIRSTRREFWACSDRYLCCASLRISPIESVLHQGHYVAETRSAGSRRDSVKVICDDRNNKRQIEVTVKTPSEVEITFVGKRRAGG